MPIGKHLKELRTQAGLTQAAVAEAIGVSVISYVRYETDKTRPRKKEIYEKLAKALNTSKDELMDLAEAVVKEDALRTAMSTETTKPFAPETSTPDTDEKESALEESTTDIDEKVSAPEKSEKESVQKKPSDDETSESVTVTEEQAIENLEDFLQHFQNLLESDDPRIDKEQTKVDIATFEVAIQALMKEIGDDSR